MSFDMNKIPHIGEVSAVHGAYDINAPVKKDTMTLKERQLMHNKMIGSIEEAIRFVGLKDGMTISFHHHFRNGDFVVNQSWKLSRAWGSKT